MTILIHSGLGKTATTSLQENAFPKTSNYIYLGKSKKRMHDPRQYLNKSISNLDNMELLNAYFLHCHWFIDHASNQRTEDDKNLTHSHQVLLWKTQEEIKSRSLQKKDYLFSHEKLSFTLSHLNISNFKTGRWTYAVENYFELFGLFGKILFINTTRSFCDFIPSLYLQLMTSRIKLGGTYIHPKTYLDAHLNLYTSNPKESIFWSYNTWSNKKLFSKYLDIAEEDITLLNMHLMTNKSVTSYLEEQTPLRFNQRERSQIDKNFSKKRHKVGSDDPLKIKIIKAISNEEHIPPEQVIDYIKLLAKDISRSLEIL